MRTMSRYEKKAFAGLLKIKKKRTFQSGKSSAASSLSSNRFLFVSFLRIAVFGRPSVIS